MRGIQKRSHRKKEHTILVIGILLFLAVLLFIDPSYTALTSKDLVGNDFVYLIDLVVIVVAGILVYRLIIRSK
ncbi:MAG: hypothetical protein AABW46_02835 [Nanoarchaeota archaeon]